MTIARDGSAAIGSASAGTITTGTLTTTGGSGEILVAVFTNATSVTGVPAATGLTFTLVGSVSGTNGWGFIALYAAPYLTNFSNTIVVTLSGSQAGNAVAQAYSGADTSGYPGAFDGAAVTNTGTTSSITTAGANDVVFSLNGLSGASDTAGSGWSLVTPSTGFYLVEDQVNVGAAAYTGTTGSASTNGSLIAALKASAGVVATKRVSIYPAPVLPFSMI